MNQKVRIRRPRRLRRSSPATTSLVAAAVAAGTVSVLFFARQSQTVPPREPPPVQIASDVDLIQVPTPSRAIAKGERLSDVPFVNTAWPRHRLSDAYIQDLEPFRSAVALTPLPKHLPIPVSAVTISAVDSNEVVEGIPEGMRAITVKVDAESAVEGWARSGNYVDVIVVRAASDSSLGLESKVIAENVKILSAGQSTVPLSSGGSAPPPPNTVTLLVSQEDALKIKTAAQIGKLTFALRGKGDLSPTTSVAMNQKRLLGGGIEVKPAPPPTYQAFARDAQGQTYVLADRGRWVRSDASLTPFPESGRTTGVVNTPSPAAPTAANPAAQSKPQP